MSEEKAIQVAEAPKAPVIVGEKGVQLGSLEDMFRFCKMVANSGLAPKGINTPEAIMVAVQSGLEIGLYPMQALQNMAVINGRPSIYGDAALALVTAHAACEGVEEGYDEAKEEAWCIVRRKGRVAVTRTFSVKDAKQAKLWGKSGPWTDYPRRMLQMRARSFAMRDSFPDALKGVGIAEEVSDIPTPVKEARTSSVILPDIEPEAQPARLELL